MPVTVPAAEGSRSAMPALTWALSPQPDSPLQVAATLHLTGLAPDQQVRVDDGAIQVFTLAGRDGAEQTGSWTLDFPKPGTYAVLVDLLDGDNFWLAELGSEAIEIADPIAEPVISIEEAAAALEALPFDAPEVAAAGFWLPYRYARPVWAGRKPTLHRGARASYAHWRLVPTWGFTPRPWLAAPCGIRPPAATGLRPRPYRSCDHPICAGSSWPAARRHRLRRHPHRRAGVGS
ncbi:MAG: hypothetical protein HZY76_13960 [Anaerolineae bacterium]|nr:MAG: hypothetical protein HZY76_13960 [Anaerolineae bacterium]